MKTFTFPFITLSLAFKFKLVYILVIKSKLEIYRIFQEKKWGWIFKWFWVHPSKWAQIFGHDFKQTLKVEKCRNAICILCTSWFSSLIWFLIIIQFPRCLEGKIVRKGKKEEIPRENSFFWSYFATNSLEDLRLKKRQCKTNNDNDRNGIEKELCNKDLSWGLWTHKSIYSGNSGKMDG